MLSLKVKFICLLNCKVQFSVSLCLLTEQSSRVWRIIENRRGHTMANRRNV